MFKMSHLQYCTLLLCLIILYGIFHCCCAQSYSFTQHPQSVLVAKGHTATLSCEWTPALNGKHTVLWSAYPRVGDTKAIEKSTLKYTLTKEATLSILFISNVDYNDEGIYKCDIYDGYTYRSSESAYVGKITCNPDNENADIGTIVTCSYYYPSYLYNSIDLMWYRDRNRLTSVLQVESNVIQSRALSTEDYGALFTCTATFKGDVIGTCETTPLPIDAQIEQSPPGTLQVGDSFNLTCSAKGNPDYYEYEWTWNDKPVESSPSKRRFAIGNVLTVESVSSKANGKIVTCTISRDGRNSSVATYAVNVMELMTTSGTRTRNSITRQLSTDVPADESPTVITTRLQSTPGTHTHKSITVRLSTTNVAHDVSPVMTTRLQSTFGTRTYKSITDLSESNIYDIDSTIVIIVIIGGVAIVLVSLITAFTFYFLNKRHKKQYDKEETKPESVPLEKPVYGNTEHNINSSEIENCENLETMYAEPDLSANGCHVKYDTPQDAVNIDKTYDSLGKSMKPNEASDAKPRKTTSAESTHAIQVKPTKAHTVKESLYSKPNKRNAKTAIEAHSKENLEDLYTRPNKPTASRPTKVHNVKESLEDLYSKPNKSTTTTPKITYEDPTKKNVEGLTYAEIQFTRGGTFPAPEPQDYGLDYATVQIKK